MQRKNFSFYTTDIEGNLIESESRTRHTI